MNPQLELEAIKKEIEPYQTTPLEYALHPDKTTLEEFEQSVWSKRHLHVTGWDTKWDFLFSWKKLNALLNQDALDANRITFSKNGEVVNLNIDHPIKKRVANELHNQIYDHLDQDYTLILNRMHDKTPELVDFTQALSSQIGEAVSTNLYCSLKDVQGFAAHYDRLDVLVIQFEGKKTWYLYDLTKDRPDESKPKIVIETKKGDVLYIPRYLWHKAIGNGPSVHGAFNIPSISYGIYYDWIYKEITKNLDLEKYIPLKLRNSPSEGYRDQNLDSAFRDIRDELMKRLQKGDLKKDFSTNLVLKDNSNTKFHIPIDVKDQPLKISVDTPLYRSQYQKHIFNEIDETKVDLIVWRKNISITRSALPIVKHIFTKTEISSKEILSAFPSMKWSQLEGLICFLLKNRILSLTPYSENWPVWN